MLGARHGEVLDVRRGLHDTVSSVCVRRDVYVRDRRGCRVRNVRCGRKPHDGQPLCNVQQWVHLNWHFLCTNHRGSNTQPDAKSDATTDTSAYIGTDAKSNTATNASANAGPNSGPNAKSDTAPNASANAGPDSGPDTRVPTGIVRHPRHVMCGVSRGEVHRLCQRCKLHGVRCRQESYQRVAARVRRRGVRGLRCRQILG